MYSFRMAHQQQLTAMAKGVHFAPGLEALFNKHGILNTTFTWGNWNQKKLKQDAAEYHLGHSLCYMYIYEGLQNSKI